MRLNIFYFILATLFVTACNKDESKTSPITSDTTLQAMLIGDSASIKGGEKGGDGKENCFELVYPLSLTMPDGSVLSGNKEELWAAIKTWYQANPNSLEKPSLNYPVDILWLKDEVTKSISDETEMEIAKKYCDEDKACFELVYPVTWTMPDGTNITMSDEEDWGATKAWYEANPDSEEKPSLHYPVDILWLKDEVIKNISDETEMEIAKKFCYEGKDCFKLVYPVTWTMSDGANITMSDEEDWDAFKAWYEANPNSEEKPNLTYPVDIEFEDGTSQVVNDEDEMVLAKKECE